MIYLQDSPASEFSSFQSELPRISNKPNQSGTFSDFSDDSLAPQNMSKHRKDDNIHIVNRMKNKSLSPINTPNIPNYLNTPHFPHKYPTSQKHHLLQKKYDQFPKQNRQATKYAQQTTKLQRQIRILAQQNSLLKQLNTKLHKQLKQITQQSTNIKLSLNKNLQNKQKIIQQLSQKLSNHQKQQTLNHQKENNQRKQKIQSLLTQTNKMKATISKMKEDINNYRVENRSLSQKNQIIAKQYQKLQQKLEQIANSERWESDFIKMFIDMCAKICNGMEQQWSIKKKTQIGWKIVKNIIQRCLDKGLKPPKLQKAHQKV